MDASDEYVPGRWNEVRSIISRAIFRDGKRPELRAMADNMAVKIIQRLVDAGYWVCRRQRRPGERETSTPGA